MCYLYVLRPRSVVLEEPVLIYTVCVGRESCLNASTAFAQGGAKTNTAERTPQAMTNEWAPVIACIFHTLGYPSTWKACCTHQIIVLQC